MKITEIKKVYMVLCESRGVVACMGVYSTIEQAYAREDECVKLYRNVGIEEFDIDQGINLIIS